MRCTLLIPLLVGALLLPACVLAQRNDDSVISCADDCTGDTISVDCGDAYEPIVDACCSTVWSGSGVGAECGGVLVCDLVADGGCAVLILSLIHI